MTRELLRDVIGTALLTAGLLLAFYGAMLGVVGEVKDGALCYCFALPFAAIGWTLV